MRFWLVYSLCLVLPSGILAVLIDSGDGTGNTTAPSSDPVWDIVGERGSSLSAVYLGDGWVLTANHVGSGPVTFDETTYSALPGTDYRLTNGDGSVADLRVFAIAPPFPDLPAIAISQSTPALGTNAILMGNGRNRGNITSWDPNGPPPPAPIGGYTWGSGHSLRWGTNQIDEIPAGRIRGTVSLTTLFDAGATTHEASGVNGDSGGALFVNNAGLWELAGILFAISPFTEQPANTSLYGNATHAADLSYYRNEIEAIRNLPEPTGTFTFGAILVAVLARRRAKSCRR